MNILLISPGGSNLYSKLNLGLPPLGVAYLAAVVREKGHQVRIIDLGIDKKPLKPQDFKSYDLVGITADTTRYQEALQVATIAKTAGKTVAMGGYHVSFLDKEALQTGIIDFVIRGEGEEIFTNLLSQLENGGGLSEIRGISYLKNGQYIRNPDALPPKELDNLPFPARDLLKMDQYRSMMGGLPLTNLITSRGCPFNCYFCSSSKFGGLKWRYRSAKNIVDELEILYHDYHFRTFAFMDDNFTLSKKRIFEFADELEKRNLNEIHWWCFSRADILIRNEDMVKRMAEAGAWEVFLGLESHNEATLNNYHKNIGNHEQEKAIDLLQKHGINIHASYIIGGLNESEKMINQTIKWAKNLKSRATQFSILTPYPGTELYLDVSKENRFLHKNWSFYDGLHPVIRSEIIKPKKLSRLLLKAYRNSYMNLKWFRKNSKNLLDADNKERIKTTVLFFKDVLSALKLFFTLSVEVYRRQKIKVER
jgi:anaerobic magnesium-protoporphyrin IX monomethyl ester cyclase